MLRLDDVVEDHEVVDEDLVHPPDGLEGVQVVLGALVLDVRGLVGQPRATPGAPARRRLEHGGDRVLRQPVVLLRAEVRRRGRRGEVERGAGRREDRRQQRRDADRDEPAEEAGAPVDAAVLVALARPGGLQRVVRGRGGRRDRRSGARGPLVERRPLAIGRRRRALGDGGALLGRGGSPVVFAALEAVHVSPCVDPPWGSTGPPAANASVYRVRFAVRTVTVCR